MRDLIAELAEVHRSVGREPADDGEIVRVVMKRTYATTPADLWAAITEPDRIRRWFMPITGELKEGGHFQLEGNAGGDILGCDPPHRLRTTFGGPESLLQLTLAEQATGQTELTLDHTVPVAMAGSVAGALFVGPGWDGAFLGLAQYVAGDAIGDPQEAALSPELLPFTRASISRWTEVVRAAGATPEELEGALAAANAQFDPQPE
ncbi:SRPBCC family protein [Actinoplanes sp. NPDC089786]|uniref:SRPBCC family protein n=1 Tax=Actinoplanes sp. NPDC089786 TaxID=3155185 RepID=UPI00344A4A7C